MYDLRSLCYNINVHSGYSHTNDIILIILIVSSHDIFAFTHSMPYQAICLCPFKLNLGETVVFRDQILLNICLEIKATVLKNVSVCMRSRSIYKVHYVDAGIYGKCCLLTYNKQQQMWNSNNCVKPMCRLT